MADGTRSSSPQGSSNDRQPRSWRHRLPRLVLLAGIALALVFLFARAPEGRSVTLRIHDPELLTQVRLVWIAEDGKDALASSEWNFDAGSAPTLLRTKVRLNDGHYRLQLHVERSNRPPKDQERRIRFEAGETETIIVVE